MLQNWWPFKRNSSGNTITAASRNKAVMPSYHIPFLAGLLLALGLWVALTLWVSVSRTTFEVGRPSPSTLRAPQSVEYVSDLRTAEAQVQAENRPENIVYTTDRNLPAQQREQLVELLNTITSIRRDPSLSSVEKREELTDLPNASIAISETLADAILSLDESSWEAVRTDSVTFYNRALAEYEGQIDADAIQRLRTRSLPFWTENMPKLHRDLVLLFTTSFLRVNRTLDEAATEQSKREAAADVEDVIVQVQAGQTIVRVGEIVRPETIEMLEATGALPKRLSVLDLAGFGLIAMLLSAVMMIYIAFLQRDVLYQPRPLFSIIGLLILTVFAARLVLPIWSDHPYTFPLATTILVLTVVFNAHLALASAALLSLVIGLLSNDALPVAVTLLASSVVAVFSVRGAEKPLTFLRAVLAIVLTVSLVQIGFWLVNTPAMRWSDVQAILLFSTINGTASTILALGLFNIAGRIAGVVTPLQLMELAHPSQALIRKVVQEAPGTYYHSVSVGNLAEAAAEAVGADALLLRVAAYYHDIGKTIRPYFFTDNQTGRENVHNELDPQTSAAIIIDHVREGVKMAQAARLPQQIIDFIATHHGTSVVSHFYQLALREQDTVNIDDFRYPGPRPFTREQGIMMLADSVEATVRAKAQHGQLLAKPASGDTGNGQARSGAQTIDELVGSIINERVRSGQLDNTSLTLRDLVLIRTAFVSSLQGIYHPRVEYAPQVLKS